MLRSETAGDASRAAAAMKGLRRYQTAPRAARRPPMPVVARSGRAVLRDYGGAGRPLLVVPSLINPPDVLDISADRSFLRWLAAAGVRPLLLDWGSPDGDARDLSIAGHVETMLLPLLDGLGRDAAVAGYCLGGTMALAAAMLRPVSALLLIGTPWRFAAYPPDVAAGMSALWRRAEPVADALGVLPMEILQAAFWRLDPARTIAKYVMFGARAEDDPAAADFVLLEDWANDGPPLPFAAARELFVAMFASDLPGRGSWKVGGRPIDPAAITAPVLEIVSRTDRIVPAATAAGIGERIVLDLGHVGMIVGRQAPAALWRPVADWLSRLPR